MSRLAFLLIVGAVLAVGACADAPTGPSFQVDHEQAVKGPDRRIPPVPGDTVRISDASEASR